MGVELVGIYDDIELYRLNDGMSYVEVMTYGARIHKICVPDKNGKLTDVVLGFNSPKDYKGDNPYFNSVVGRVANRIGGSKFVIDGKTYYLSQNEKSNHLHGGKQGFDRKLFKAHIEGSSLCLQYLSPNGDEGYPGDLLVNIKYTFACGSLEIEYFASSNAKTHCNLTNHAYFNLNGDFSPITNHMLKINSKAITDIDDELIPTGGIIDICGTGFDFSNGARIGEHLFDNNRLMAIGGGYDFNYILDNSVNDQPQICLSSEKTGICLQITTTAPCVQFYSGNFLDGSIVGKAQFNKHCAVALEPQLYPNAANIATFPSTLMQNNVFTSKTTYKFCLLDC